MSATSQFGRLGHRGKGRYGIRDSDFSGLDLGCWSMAICIRVAAIMEQAMSELKNQELPPLDVTDDDMENGLFAAQKTPGCLMTTQGDCNFAARLACRERQLSAALNELKAKDTELAAKDARIAELERKGGEVCAVLGNLGIHIHDLGLRPTEPGWQFRNARAEAAEKSLRAVSEVLKENLSVMVRAGGFYYYKYPDINDWLARLRSIVEGNHAK